MTAPGQHPSAGRAGSPSPQKHLQSAIRIGFEAVSRQSADQLAWLGAEPADGLWRLPVLDGALVVDLAAGRLCTSAGEAVGPVWCVLALHYLAVPSRPESRPPEITFADLPTARSYAGVYQARVVSRLCGTVGRNAQSLREACAARGGRFVDGGDVACEFAVFPRISLRLIWHAPDDEFPPSATVLLPGNIEEFLCSEDVVVLSESLVSRLNGRPF